MPLKKTARSLSDTGPKTTTGESYARYRGLETTPTTLVVLIVLILIVLILLGTVAGTAAAAIALAASTAAGVAAVAALAAVLLTHRDVWWTRHRVERGLEAFARLEEASKEILDVERDDFDESVNLDDLVDDRTLPAAVLPRFVTTGLASPGRLCVADPQRGRAHLRV
ncbi:hypothetical protein, partial [Thiohalospira sp.]|uniref:hypothetical protein n=1 Tax=Thiohalospira sp. TaxID=3080549 RepID=UPI003980D071